jgi:hypothetical protein
MAITEVQSAFQPTAPPGEYNSVYTGNNAFLQAISKTNGASSLGAARYFFPTLPEVIGLHRSAEFKNEQSPFMPEPFMMYLNPSPCIVELNWSVVADGKKLTMQQIMADAAFIHSLVLPLGNKINPNAGDMAIAVKCILAIGEWFNAEGVILDSGCDMKGPWDLPRTMLPRAIDMKIKFQIAELYNTSLGTTDYENNSIQVKHDARSVRDKFYGSNLIKNIQTAVSPNRRGP